VASNGDRLAYPLALALGGAALIALASSWMHYATRFSAGVLAQAGAPSASPARELATVCVAATVAGVIFGVVARAIGFRVGLVVTPRLWQSSAHPRPLLGSVAIFSGLAVGLVVGVREALSSAQFVGAAVGVAVMGTVGLVDDVKGLTPRTRLVITAIAAQFAWLLGIRAHVFSDGIAGDVGNAAITMLWFVGVTHAFNVLDNMDGISAGTALASSVSIGMLAMISDQWVLATLCFALAGGCIGYLVHNLHPAQLYMGDSGALAVGFSLAALGLVLRPSTPPPLGFALPVLAVGFPIFDTVLVSISRRRAGRPVAVGGTDHTSHRLVAAGRSLFFVVFFLFAAQLALGLIAVFVTTQGRVWGWAILATVALLGVVALRIFLRLPEWRPREVVAAALEGREGAVRDA
jgi:UDP-GlcNAc:undecaprenyl-phosphate GlcNAc-1-phosphate transferase